MVSPDRILAMQQAIEDRNLPKVRLLLKAGVPAHHVYEPRPGWTFAMLAARTGDLAVFSCLVEAGADMTGRDEIDTSLIQEAVCSKSASPEIVAKILAEGVSSQASLNAALLFAPEFGSLEIVNLLLEAGASPHYADHEGATALMHAVMYRRSAIAVRLAEAGADRSRRVPYEEHYKKTIDELAALYEMQDLLQVVVGKPRKTKAKAKTKVLPQTLDGCLQALDDWLRANAPNVRLGPVAPVSLPEPFRSAPGANELATLLARLDGSCDASLIPMRGDVSYVLLPLAEGLEERGRWVQLRVAEGPLAGGQDWQVHWMPIASNGGGDSLVWDATTGVVLAFSHETRQAVQRAASLYDLFSDLASGLQSGKYTYSEERGIA